MHSHSGDRQCRQWGQYELIHEGPEHVPYWVTGTLKCSDLTEVEGRDGVSVKK